MSGETVTMNEDSVIDIVQKAVRIADDVERLHTHIFKLTMDDGTQPIVLLFNRIRITTGNSDNADMYESDVESDPHIIDNLIMLYEMVMNNEI